MGSMIQCRTQINPKQYQITAVIFQLCFKIKYCTFVQTRDRGTNSSIEQTGKHILQLDQILHLLIEGILIKQIRGFAYDSRLFYNPESTQPTLSLHTKQSSTFLNCICKLWSSVHCSSRLFFSMSDNASTQSDSTKYTE